MKMRRHKDGRDYSVLPGGGVEEDEDASCAAIRELHEETGLSGRVVRHLATIDHPDRTAHYFLLEVVPGPMRVGGPGAEAPSNRYSPEWVPLSALEQEPIVPEDVRSVIYAARISRTRAECLSRSA
jgi:8-oxo-dGTP diphosphatase